MTPFSLQVLPWDRLLSAFPQFKVRAVHWSVMCRRSQPRTAAVSASDPDLCELIGASSFKTGRVLVLQYWGSGDVSSVSMASPDCCHFTRSLIRGLVS